MALPTTLAADATAIQTHIDVADAADQDGDFVVLIGSERIYVVHGGLVATSYPNLKDPIRRWQVIRGYQGTARATHDAEDAVSAVSLTADNQPLDADLTSIAALSTTTLGRSVLAAANAGALQTIVGISTFVKTILDDADAEAVRTTIGAGVGSYSKPSTPEVPAVAITQDIVDALVTLGLVTQAAP